MDRAVEIQVRGIARCVDEDRDQWQLVNYRCTTEVQVIQAAFSSDQAEGCVARCRLQYMADHGADHGTDHGSTLDVDNTKYFCSNGTNPKQCQADIHAETHTHTNSAKVWQLSAPFCSLDQGKHSKHIRTHTHTPTNHTMTAADFRGQTIQQLWLKRMSWVAILGLPRPHEV